MQYLVTVHGLTYASPKHAGESWKDQLATLLGWLAAAVALVPETKTDPDGVHVFLPHDLFDGIHSSNVIIRVEPMGGQPMAAETEQSVRIKLVDRMQQFCKVNDLPVPPGHIQVFFAPTHQQ